VDAMLDGIWCINMHVFKCTCPWQTGFTCERSTTIWITTSLPLKHTDSAKQNSAYEIHTLWWPLRPIRCSYSMCTFLQSPGLSISGIASADQDTPSSNMASAHKMSSRSVSSLAYLIHLVEIVGSYWNTVIYMMSGWKQQILCTLMYFLYSICTWSNSRSWESVRSKIVDSDGHASISTWM